MAEGLQNTELLSESKQKKKYRKDGRKERQFGREYKDITCMLRNAQEIQNSGGVKSIKEGEVPQKVFCSYNSNKKKAKEITSWEGEPSDKGLRKN